VLKVTHVKRIIDYSELKNIANEDVIVTCQVCELLKVFEYFTEETRSEKQASGSKIIVLSQSLKKWHNRFIKQLK
jgi:hypothetical protein